MTFNNPAVNALPHNAGQAPTWPRWAEPRRAFLLIALLFGLCLVFLTAPFQAPDEPAHFYRAYQISEGYFLPVTDAPHGHGGGNLPASLEAVADEFDQTKPFERLRAMHPNARQSDVKVSWSQIQTALRVPLRPEQRKFTRTVAAIYSPASYVPQALAIWVGRHCGLGPLPLMYLGRMGNLLCWIALGYLALRVTPTCRRPLLLLLLMPMTLFQAASLSCDPTTNAIATLFVAMVLRYVDLNGRSRASFTEQTHEPTVPRSGWTDGPPGNANLPIGISDNGQSGDWRSQRIGAGACVVFVIVSVMLALTKFVYLPLLALVFLIPPSRLGGPRRYVIAVGVLGLLSVAALLAWTLQTLGQDMVVMDKPGISPSGQIQFLRAHPGHLWTVITGTLSEKSWGIIRSFVGYLGRLDTRMHHVFTDGYLIVLFAACWLQEESLSFSRRLLAIIVVIPVAIAVFAITLLNYVYDNPVGKEFANGLQGRYLIPLAPAVILLFWGLAPRWARDLSRGRSAMLNAGAAVLVLGSCVYTVIVVWVRYYGHASA